jgi:hypothetical protein
LDGSEHGHALIEAGGERRLVAVIQDEVHGERAIGAGADAPDLGHGLRCGVTQAAQGAQATGSRAAVQNVITMPMMFLCGVYFPVSGAPDWLKPLINILPLTYLANGLRDVMEHGQGLRTIGVDFLVLAITAIVGFGVAARPFRWE